MNEIKQPGGEESSDVESPTLREYVSLTASEKKIVRTKGYRKALLWMSVQEVIDGEPRPVSDIIIDEGRRNELSAATEKITTSTPDGKRLCQPKVVEAGARALHAQYQQFSKENNNVFGEPRLGRHRFFGRVPCILLGAAYQQFLDKSQNDLGEPRLRRHRFFGRVRDILFGALYQDISKTPYDELEQQFKDTNLRSSFDLIRIILLVSYYRTKNQDISAFLNEAIDSKEDIQNSINAALYESWKPNDKSENPLFSFRQYSSLLALAKGGDDAENIFNQDTQLIKDYYDFLRGPSGKALKLVKQFRRQLIQEDFIHKDVVAALLSAIQQKRSYDKLLQDFDKNRIEQYLKERIILQASEEKGKDFSMLQAFSSEIVKMIGTDGEA